MSTSLFDRPEFSPLSLLRAFWKHKILGGLVAIITTTIGVFVVCQLPAVYKAEALVLVDPQKIPERFVTSTVSSDAQDRLATISQEILSKTRLREIIDTFHLYPESRGHAPDEAIQKMRADLDIHLERGLGVERPSAFRVTYQAPDPVVAAKVVECITKLYIEENHRSREVQAEGTFNFMDNQLRDAKQALDEQEQALSRYKLQHNGELPQQETSLNATLARLQLLLQGNQDAANRAQQNKVVLESTLSAAETAEANLAKELQRAHAAQAAGLEPEPAAEQPRAPKASEALEARLEALRLRYSDEHPDIKRLKLDLEATRKVERREEAMQRTSAAPAVAARPVAAPYNPVVAEKARATERVANLKAQLAAANREIQDRAAERERIVRDLASYQRRIEQLPVRDLEMSSLTRNYEFSRGYYNNLLNKKTEAEMATDLEKRQKAETFRVLDQARAPKAPFKPKRQMLFGFSAVFGLILGVVAAVAPELKKGVLLGEWELPDGIQVLGRVCRIEPSLKGMADPAAPPSGQRERVKATRRLAITSSGFLLLICVAVATYRFGLWRF